MDTKKFAEILTNPGKCRIPERTGEVYGGKIIETLTHAQLKKKLNSMYVKPIQVGEASTLDAKIKLEIEAWKIQLGLYMLAKTIVPVLDENAKLKSENFDLQIANEGMKFLLPPLEEIEEDLALDGEQEVIRNFVLFRAVAKPVACASSTQPSFFF